MTVKFIFICYFYITHFSPLFDFVQAYVTDKISIFFVVCRVNIQFLLFSYSISSYVAYMFMSYRWFVTMLIKMFVILCLQHGWSHSIFEVVFLTLDLTHIYMRLKIVENIFISKYAFVWIWKKHMCLFVRYYWWY